MNYRYCLGQDGLALQRNVDTLLLAVKQADGCEPRHVRCDRKRKRSFSGLSTPFYGRGVEKEGGLHFVVHIYINFSFLLPAFVPFLSSCSNLFL